ncbi:MAG: lysophospholipase [Spirochaetes bacterium]|nr:lysophospholipase [Spirochaetota bacterium]
MESYTYNSGTFIGKGGTEIFFQNWDTSSPRGILVIAHGVGEHGGRYTNIIRELAKNGISIYAPDHRGHGRSGGPRGHVESFMDYVYDLKLFIDLIKEEKNELPLVLLGHSMGGVIACKYALSYPDDVDALVLSSPAVMPAVEVPAWKTKLGKVFSRYAPSFSMKTGLNPEELSHDLDVVDAYENDRLVHDHVSARWYTEFTKAGEECINRALELRMPLMVFQGREDKIVDYRGSETLFRNASSLKKELHIFEGLYHETMNEKDNVTVLQLVARWITGAMRIKKSVKGANKNAPKKPIKKTKRKSVAKKTVSQSLQRVPRSRGAKKTKIKKGERKIVATIKKTAKKKTVKKAAKKAAKKTAKKTAKKKTAKKKK